MGFLNGAVSGGGRVVYFGPVNDIYANCPWDGLLTAACVACRRRHFSNQVAPLDAGVEPPTQPTLRFGC